MFLDAIETQQPPTHISANQLTHRKLAYNAHGEIDLFVVGNIALENEGAVAFTDDFMPYRSANARQEQVWNCAILVFHIIKDHGIDQQLYEAIKNKLSKNIKNPEQVVLMLLQAFREVSQGQSTSMVPEAYLQFRLSICDQNKFNQFLFNMIGHQQVPMNELMAQIVRTQVMADLNNRTPLRTVSVQNEPTDDWNFDFNFDPTFTPAQQGAKTIKRRPYMGTKNDCEQMQTDAEDADRNARREQKLWNTTLYN